MYIYIDSKGVYTKGKLITHFFLQIFLCFFSTVYIEQLFYKKIYTQKKLKVNLKKLKCKRKN